MRFPIDLSNQNFDLGHFLKFEWECRPVDRIVLRHTGCDLLRSAWMLREVPGSAAKRLEAPGSAAKGLEAPRRAAKWLQPPAAQLTWSSQWHSQLQFSRLQHRGRCMKSNTPILFRILCPRHVFNRTHSSIDSVASSIILWSKHKVIISQSTMMVGEC